MTRGVAKARGVITDGGVTTTGGVTMAGEIITTGGVTTTKWVGSLAENLFLPSPLTPLPHLEGSLRLDELP